MLRRSFAVLCWLVLVFYPRDFSLICPTELTALNARLGEFRGVGAEILAVSVDSVSSHARWLSTPTSKVQSESGRAMHSSTYPWASWRPLRATPARWSTSPAVCAPSRRALSSETGVAGEVGAWRWRSDAAH